MRYAERRLAELCAANGRARYTDRLKFDPGATEKPCSRCGIVKPLEQFSELKHGALGRNPVCKACRCLIGKEYTRLNREAKAGRPRPDVCDCCGSPPRRRALHWDHNHASGAFRGWLCHGCNAALGNVQDSIAQLELLIAYLRKHS